MHVHVHGKDVLHYVWKVFSIYMLLVNKMHWRAHGTLYTICTECMCMCKMHADAMLLLNVNDLFVIESMSTPFVLTNKKVSDGQTVVCLCLCAWIFGYRVNQAIFFFWLDSLSIFFSLLENVDVSFFFHHWANKIIEMIKWPSLMLFVI